MGQLDKGAAVHEVIQHLYEAAVTSEQWEDALDRLYSLFDSMSAHFIVWNRVLDQAVASHGSRTFMGTKEALEHYLRIDPRRAVLARQPVGLTLLCHEHFDEAFVRQDRFFQEYSLPRGRRFLMAAKLLQVGPTASEIAVLRSPRQGPFQAADTALFEQLKPHLQCVARMHSHLRQVHRDFEIAGGLLDMVPSGLIATDAAACIVRTNHAAETLLRTGDGLRVVAERIVARTHAQTETLHGLIRRAAAIGAGETIAGCGGMVIDGLANERHGIMVTPLSRRSTVLDKPERPLVLVTISHLAQHAGPDRHLIGMFALTPAEARLASEVAAGKRLDVLAAEHKVRISTLRTQMRAIYSKTGTRRQAELVHLVHSVPRPHGTR